MRRLEDAGAAAVVLPSLFEEEILHEELELNRPSTPAPSTSPRHSTTSPTSAVRHAGDRYLDASPLSSQPSVPVIASLNATSTGGWIRYAAHRATPAPTPRAEPVPRRRRPAPDATTSRRDLEIITAVRAEVDIPLAVKLSPYYSAMADFARDVVRAGADGLVLFNRFYQPDLDLETLSVVPRVELSSPSELRLPLRWIAILSPLLAGRASLAATSGIASGTDVVKALLVGADVAMMTSTLLRHGPEHVAVIESELVAWLTEREYRSVAQIRGSASHATSGDPAAFERAGYVRTLHSWSAPHHLTPSSPSRVAHRVADTRADPGVRFGGGNGRAERGRDSGRASG